MDQMKTEGSVHPTPKTVPQNVGFNPTPKTVQRPWDLTVPNVYRGGI